MFSRLGLRHVCVCMLSTCAHILKVCVHIQLGYIRRPYVCTCILVPRNPNLTLFASVSLFCLHNMLLFCPVFMPISLRLPCSFFVFPSHGRLGFLFFSFFEMPWTCIWYNHAFMHRCCSAVRYDMHSHEPTFVWDMILILPWWTWIIFVNAYVITCLFDLNMPMFLFWMWHVCLVAALNMMIWVAW